MNYSEIEYKRNRRFDWFMLLLIVPIALLSAFVIYYGSKDVEKKKEQEQTINIDSLRQIHRELRTLEDSVHYYEDGM